jgi:hypothetical protein
MVERPIFVFGCCNSGTTILWQALKKHQALSGPDVEDQDIDGMPDSMRHWLGRETFRLWAHPKFGLCYYTTERDCDEGDKEKLQGIYQRFLIPGTRLVAKSPAHTLRARLIQSYFLDAYFVAIVRNGYAVTEGIIRKRKFDPDRPQFQRMLTTVEEAAEQWFRANTVIVSHQSFLCRYLIIKYEDLVERPEATLHTVLNHCGLDTIKFPVPVFEKKNNEAQIARLPREEVDIVTRIAGPILHHFGYVQ